MARARRMPWNELAPELERLVREGWSHPRIAKHFGCSVPQVAQACLRRGIKAVPEAVIRNRAVSVKAACQRPEVRARKREARLKMQAEVPGELERLRANLAAIRCAPDVSALIARKQSERQLAHIPPPFRKTYRSMTKRGVRAAAALARLKPEIDAWLRTFDGQLWRVSTGQARVVPNVKVSRPATYVAMAGAMS